jgi:hypothetical protein
MTRHRRTWMRSASVLALLAFLAGCGETGRQYVTFPMLGVGVENASFEQDGWLVTLDRADVAFGPAYFCATSGAAMDLCSTALAELLDPITVDALDPTDQSMGEVTATTGTVRSAFFDYGISWLLTQARPTTWEAAPEGYSAVFAGHADNGVDAVTFEARVRIAPFTAGAAAVTGARTTHTIMDDTAALRVRMDPVAWWRRVDMDAVVALAEDGAALLTEGTGPHDALVIAMTSGSTVPTFEWSTDHGL